MFNALPDWLKTARTITIVGMGREGQSTQRFLEKYLPNIRVSLYDDNPTIQQSNNEAILPVSGQLIDADVLFKSPGIQLSAISYKLQAFITSQSDLFVQMFGKQTIGITGTKGKSTTAHAIAEVLNTCGKRAILVGNIGKPALDFVEEMMPETLAVFEMSAFQCESLHQAPHIGVFTSLYQDHLDYYDTMEEYKAAKKHLFDLQTEEDYCLFRDDYPELVSLLADCKAKKITYRQSDTDGDVNLIPAMRIAELFGGERTAIESAVGSVKNLPGRCENMGTYRGITFYDDALATIPEATIRAIEKLKKVDTLILGGFDRKQSYEALASKIAASGIRTLVLFPTTGVRIGNLVCDQNPSISLVPATSMHDAVKACYSHTPINGVVLLSTAAPSFGLFTDYMDRSTQYKHWIEALGKV